MVDPQGARRPLGLILTLGLALLAALGWLGWRALADGEQADELAVEDQGSAAVALDDARARSTPRTAVELRGADKAAVSGRVHDEAGQGIAGARVCAIPNTDALLGVAKPEPICVRSEADGHYELPGLWPVRSRLVASAAGYEAKTWRPSAEIRAYRARIDLSPAQRREGVDFELPGGGVVLTGVVKDIAGGPIDSAWVSSGAAYARSDEAGAFELWVSAGTRGVSASSEGYADGMVRALAPSEFVELFLTPESVLVGRVVDAETGAPIAGATVYANRHQGHGALSDDGGSFRIYGLEPGIYKPRATTDHGYGEVAESVHLGLGQTSDAVEISVHPMTLVEGTVVVAGAEARPCEDGGVRLSSAAGQRYSERIDSADGWVRFRGVAPGEYQVVASCRDKISAERYPKLVVGEDDQRDLVWEVSEGLAIRGEVVDEGGEPVEGVRVSARMIVEGEAAREQQRTNSSDASLDDGSFAIGGLLPGRYEISTANWRGARPGPSEPLERELDAGADINDVRIVMPATGRVVGRVVDASGQPVVAALDAVHLDVTGPRGRARSGDDGRFELEHLYPGKTRITAKGGHGFFGETMRAPGTSDDDVQGELVEVVANELVEVELVVQSRSGRIRGRVVDASGGPVPDAFVSVERMSDAAGALGVNARRGVRWSWGEQPVLTDQDGSFVLDGLPEGAFIIHAHREGGGEALAEGVALGSEVELVIATTGELAGTVTFAGGAPERFELAIREPELGFDRRETFFRTDGAWRLRELPAGRYEITATAGGGTSEAEVELGEGEVREGVALTLNPRLTLEGRIVDLDTREPVAGLSVVVSTSAYSGIGRTADAERKNISDADGRFVIEDAPSGLVRIYAWKIGQSLESREYDGVSQMMELAPEPIVQDIGELEVIRRRIGGDEQPGDLGLETKQYDALYGDPETFEIVVALVRPGGPAAKAGLEAGDEIVAVDGHDVRGTNAGRWPSLTRVKPGTKLALTLADDRELTLLVGPGL